MGSVQLIKLLIKAAQFEIENSKFKFFVADKGKIKYEIRANFSNGLIKNVSKQYYKSMRKLNLQLSEKLILKPEWRMIIGLGTESVHETSMTLHHIYGITYIPGSAIKDVVRSYIVTEEFEKDEKRALEKQCFCGILGCSKDSFYEQSRQGKVIFFDAFPLSVPKIKMVSVQRPRSATAT